MIEENDRIGVLSHESPMGSEGPGRWGVGEYASDPEPRGEADNERENATIKAKPESTQESIAEGGYIDVAAKTEVDEQTQSAPAQGDPSWDKIPILSDVH